MPGKYLHTAYLMSRYPAVSHTFFLQEIAGLRALGVRIHTASVNTVDRNHQLSEAEHAEMAQTFYLKGRSSVASLLTLSRIVVAHPRVTLRGLKAALALEPWHLTHTLYALFYCAEAMLLGDWLRRGDLRHLHIHFSGPVASVGMIASRAWKVPYSMTVHGPDEFFDQHETALEKKISNAAFVVCISDFCRSQLMRITAPQTWSKLRVIRLGIQPALVTTRENAGAGRADGEVFRVLCTGRLVSAKGQGILILAAAELLQRGHRLHITFIGDGEDRPALQALVDVHSLREFVTFAGAQTHDQVLASLHSSDMFVLPSFAEGVPVALMEAMAIGVPCISTFIAGIPELIRHEQDGLLVPAGSILELTNAIERLILSLDERKRFSESAREQVLTHYNLPKNLEVLAATMTSLAPYAVREYEKQ